MNFKILSEKFDTDVKCLAYLENLRWGMTKKCPHCDSDKVRYYAVEKRYVCNNCLKKFSVANGTMFEHTRYPLTDWFKVITLILNAKQGISAMNIMSNMDCS